MKTLNGLLAIFLIFGFLMVPSAVFALETPQGSESLTSAVAFEDGLQPLFKGSSSSKVKIHTDDDDITADGDGSSWWIYLVIALIIVVAIIVIWYFFLRK